MKKTIVIILVIIGIAFSISTSAFYVKHPGEWSDWWKLSESGSGKIKRIYDHENKLVCWIARGYSNDVSIDCQPSLELKHPSTIK